MIFAWLIFCYSTNETPLKFLQYRQSFKTLVEGILKFDWLLGRGLKCLDLKLHFLDPSNISKWNCVPVKLATGEREH